MTFQRRDSGGSWIDPNLKRYDGSAWTQAQVMKRYDGSQWVTVWKYIQLALTDKLFASSAFYPSNAEAGFELTRDGELVNYASSTAVTGEWVAAGGDLTVGDDYEARVTHQSGTVPSGDAVGTWVTLSTTRTWTVTRSSVGMSSSQVLVEIRPIGGSVEASAVFDIEARVRDEQIE